MSENTPLWVLAANCALGVVLIAWMILTLIPFLLGTEPLLPGMEAAFVGSCMWAGWNASLILKGDK